MTCRMSSDFADSPHGVRARLDADGFAVVAGLVAAAEIEPALDAFEPLIAAGSAGTRRGPESVLFVRRWLETRPAVESCTSSSRGNRYRRD